MNVKSEEEERFTVKLCQMKHFVAQFDAGVSPNAAEREQTVYIRPNSERASKKEEVSNYTTSNGKQTNKHNKDEYESGCRQYVYLLLVPEPNNKNLLSFF